MTFEYDVETTGPNVWVLDDEYEALADLVCASPRATPGLALLWHELERASRLKADEAPDDLITVGTRLAFTDLARRESRIVTLVLPQEADGLNRIAVTSSVGAALLGLQTGKVFEWKTGDGEARSLRVDAVAREAA